MSNSISPINQTALQYIEKAIASQHLHGDGPLTHACESMLATITRSNALLTHSCTGALEMMPLVLNLQPGDEVIVPSYTFVSTASAFALRGATPVFVDVDLATGNIDPAQVALAITPKTKAVCIVHYAGVACDMDALSRLCDDANIALLEDAAQAIGASYRDQPLGSIGRLGALSFHQTKNIGCGEGGCLLVNHADDLRPAQYIREKGTNRIDFINGKIDKYSWVTLGSSFLPSELQAAVLRAELENLPTSSTQRLDRWSKYATAFDDLAAAGTIVTPTVPEYANHNAHIFGIRVPNSTIRTNVLTALNQAGYKATSHYVPLHSSPAGQKVGRTVGSCANSQQIAETIVRLPMDRALLAQDYDRMATIVAEAI